MADELLNELNRLADSAEFQPGALLFRRDQPSHSVYIVRRGSIALLWPDEETTPMEVRGPGSIIGLPAAINGTYSVTARAAMDSEVGAIPAATVVHRIHIQNGQQNCLKAIRRSVGQPPG